MTNDGDIPSLWEKFHDRIKNVHLAENVDKETDTHPQLGKGEVNFPQVIENARKYEYDGALIIEVFSSATLRNSTKFIKTIL